MITIQSYVNGEFASGGEQVPLLNPATEETVAVACCGVDAAAALRFARERGIPALQSLTFAQRAELLARMAAVIHEHRDALIDASVSNNGATRSGAKFDIDGASGALAAYAEIGKQLGERGILCDGEGVGLGRGARLFGAHAWFSRPGVAVFINAFNFPAWGFAEKAAAAILAGMPVISKPATATALTAGRLAEILVQSAVLPPGAFSQVLGPVTELLNLLGPQDQVAFTGSSETAAKIRGNQNLVRNAVRVNIEADSLNAAVVDPLLDVSSPLYQVLLRDLVREMTEKTGQKCTATRRVLVAEPLLEKLVEDLKDRIGSLKVGNPANAVVELGPLATADQRRDVVAGIERLKSSCQHVHGEARPGELVDVPVGKGFFVGPHLFVARAEKALSAVHAGEVFGPVCTLIPYDGNAASAGRLVASGGGCLVSEVYADDRGFMQQAATLIAPYCGRVVLVDSKSEGFTLPPGMVLPQLVHGGPGRAGGGEELGGMRGLQHYLHRTAFQGSRAAVERLLS